MSIIKTNVLCGPMCHSMSPSVLLRMYYVYSFGFTPAFKEALDIFILAKCGKEPLLNHKI